MPTFAVNAIRVRQPDERITDLRLHETDADAGARVGPDRVVPASEVATSILAGDSYFPVFNVMGQRVLGPRLDCLVKGLVCDAQHCPAGRTLMDLPRF